MTTLRTEKEIRKKIEDLTFDVIWGEDINNFEDYKLKVVGIALLKWVLGESI